MFLHLFFLSVLFILFVACQKFRKEKKSFYGVEVNNYFGGGEEKFILFTFDDGPNYEHLKKLHETLEHPSVFFFVGETMIREREKWGDSLVNLLHDMVRKGHWFGSHTMSHQRIRDLSKEEFSKEYYDMQVLFQQIMGFEFRIFRPPFGRGYVLHNSFLESFNVARIQWNIDSEDFKCPDEPCVIESFQRSLENNVTRRYGDGGFVLFHENEITVNSISKIQDNLKFLLEGYRFLPLPAFLPIQMRKVLLSHFGCSSLETDSNFEEYCKQLGRDYFIFNESFKDGERDGRDDSCSLSREKMI